MRAPRITEGQVWSDPLGQRFLVVGFDKKMVYVRHPDTPKKYRTVRGAGIVARSEFKDWTNHPQEEDSIMAKKKSKPQVEAPAPEENASPEAPASEEALRAEMAKHEDAYKAYQEHRAEGVPRKENPQREGYTAYKRAYNSLLALKKKQAGA